MTDPTPTPAHALALSPLAVRLLSACCAEPQSQAQIEAVLWRRGPGVRGHPFRYALTPAGEAMLERLWR